MQIQQAVQNLLSASQPLPVQLINQLTAGQQLEAVVIRAALEGQLATLKLADTLVNIRAPIAVKQGESVQIALNQNQGKPIVSFTPSTTATTAQPTYPPIPALTQGQQLTAEVIKLLADNKILVELKPNTPQLVKTQAQPAQIEIDISKLNKPFTLAERVQIEVLSTKPLNVALSAQTLTKEQAIVQRIQQLLTNQPASSTVSTLSVFNRDKTTQTLPAPVQRAIQNVLTAITDKQQIKQPQVLKRAIEQSGTFSEKQLLQRSNTLQSDFKANIAKLVSTIESTLQQYQRAIATAGKTEGQSAKSTAVLSTQPPVAPSVKKLHSPFAPRQASATPLTAEKAAPVLQGSGATTSVQSNGIENSKPAVKTLRSPFAPQQKIDSNAGASQASAPKSTVNQTSTETIKPAEQIAPRPQTTSAAVLNQPRTSQALPPLSALIQASISDDTSRPALLALSTPPKTAVMNSFVPLTDSVLSSPNQALTLAKMLSQSISSDHMRSLQMNFLILQNLLREVESVQARVQLNQFSMLKEPDTPNAPVASWLLDIPLKDKSDVDLLQLQIDQHRKEDTSEDNNIWNVRLRLDTQNLGPLQATVTMHAEEFKVVLRAERAESAELIEQHLDILQDAFSDMGIVVNSLSCICGEVPRATLSERYLSETTNLVDISI